MNATDEQLACRDHAVSLSPGEHLKIHAFAGAGKTTTLKLIAQGMPGKGCYLAFNKAIAEEAKTKLALTRCTAASMHSMAYRAMRDMIGSPASLSARMLRDSGIMNRFSVQHIKGWHDFRLAQTVLRTLVTFCNSADDAVRPEHAEAALISVVGDPETIQHAGRRARAAAALHTYTGLCRDMAENWIAHLIENETYSHDLYLKILDLDPDMRREAFRGYRYLMVDEAQDLNPVQRSILTKTGVSLIAVGDPYQQIYSWRGAENALAQLPGKSLYLTRSFRFGDTIAAIGRDILASRPDGGPGQRLIGAGSGDASGFEGCKAAVICRTNMGVFDAALDMARRDIPFRLDNIETLINEVKAAQALYEGRPSDGFVPGISEFADWQELKAEAADGDPGLSRIVQIVEARRADEIGKLCDMHASTVNPRVMICTAHRSKGMEWPHVKMGPDWRDINVLTSRFNAKKKESLSQETLALEEWNTMYVAATRAITRLVGIGPLLNPDPLGDNPVREQARRGEMEPA